ncbi:serine/threonine-protein kinase/endoribonuclease IRE1-like [Diaphorina citri]|uniref:Serine/threonine-protein kinase/endoribonuclease IRE1-like n=1 Tax=Diaphorina citri TaxID=121845 RepID=A0A3Q0ITR7_DIACI|nr:serine/threonine-protein kinase/endoribonuclease IRE1-like [Diaphorina citri]
MSRDDVSDRIEKEEVTDPVVLNLERGAHVVTQGDWRLLIDRLDFGAVLQKLYKWMPFTLNLCIVHRDIKPHNVLLSLPTSEGRVRALISDFGLCKKLASGKVSFSKRSGVTGTDGWIAPEMMANGGRTMCNVDIFSLGCVFYFVLSGGRHPFGDPLRRQANILAGDYSLELATSELWARLVEAMISREPEQRPSAATVAVYPAFWDNNQVLNFLQDVSDRIEKEEVTDPVVLNLERGAHVVTQGDWRLLIDPEVASDLRKYRNYRGESLRDLLRALRNKVSAKVETDYHHVT